VEDPRYPLFPIVIWIVLNPISSKFLARVTLFFFVITAVLFALHKSDQVGQFAVFTYNFLGLTMIIAITEFSSRSNISERNK